MEKASRSFVLGGFVFVLSVSASAAQTTSAPARRLPAPQHVSPQTQNELKARMAQHGTTMQSLVQAVVLLDRPTIQVLANRIADEEAVARASGMRDKHPPLLPPGFFTAQDELAAAGRQLAAVAVQGGDYSKLADAFAAVTRTCVSCHGTYVGDRPAPLPVHPKPRSESAATAPGTGAR